MSGYALNPGLRREFEQPSNEDVLGGRLGKPCGRFCGISWLEWHKASKRRLWQGCGDALDAIGRQDCVNHVHATS
jgi:hypothetical protein